MVTLDQVKSAFPALANSQVVYLDSASTTQVPKVVVEKMMAYELSGRGNPQRGLYTWAATASEELKRSREIVAKFIGAQPDELLFTKGTTEGLNLLARALAHDLGPGDEVVITIFEHHANLLPWRELSKERGFELKYLPMSADGSLDLNTIAKILTDKTKVVSLALVSNVLGNILPVAEVAELAHRHGAVVLVDAAQAVGRLPVNVEALGCDALAFGAHKMYGPEGIGALYLRSNLKTRLKPLLYGGGMVDEVTDGEVKYATDVRLFEAGSSNVGGAIGFAAACEFLSELGIENIRKHELELLNALITELAEITGVVVYTPDPAFGRAGVLSFTLGDLHPHDVAQILADQNIAIRAGYHCAEPLTKCLAPAGTVRVSFGIYNTLDDVKGLKAGLLAVVSKLSSLATTQA